MGVDPTKFGEVDAPVPYFLYHNVKVTLSTISDYPDAVLRHVLLVAAKGLKKLLLRRPRAGSGTVSK